MPETNGDKILALDLNPDRVRGHDARRALQRRFDYLIADVKFNRSAGGRSFAVAELLAVHRALQMYDEIEQWKMNIAAALAIDEPGLKVRTPADLIGLRLRKSL